MTFVGDIVNYNNHDGLVCSRAVEKRIKEADFAVCNFEAPIKNTGKPILKSGPHHSQQENTIKGLKAQGFDLFCLANNHIMDFGISGLAATINECNNQEVEHIGAGFNSKSAYKPLVKTINGKKFGFVNVCEAQFGVLDYNADEEEAGYAWINHRKVNSLIKKLQETCNYVVVIAHAGLEHYSVPQLEWRERYREFCDLGADAVIAHHPHVPQGIEKYNSSIICYSLGNFYFDSTNYMNKRDDSYFLELNFNNNGLTYEVVPYFKEENKVHLSSKTSSFSINELNNYLVDDRVYTEMLNKMSLEAFEKKIKNNYLYNLSGLSFNSSFLFLFKGIIKQVLKRNFKQKEASLLHLLRNEAYYYASKRALELKYKRGTN
nr:CapA family protein [Evansella sp. LMS18]